MTVDRFAQLAARGEARSAALAPTEPAPELGPIHGAVLGFFDQVLGLVGGDQMPAAARTMLTMIKASRPMMVDSLARMPEDRLREVLEGLRDRIDYALGPDDRYPPALADLRGE